MAQQGATHAVIGRTFGCANKVMSDRSDNRQAEKRKTTATIQDICIRTIHLSNRFVTATLTAAEACWFLGYSQAVSDTGNLSGFLCEMDMLPTAIIIGPKTEHLLAADYDVEERFKKTAAGFTSTYRGPFFSYFSQHQDWFEWEATEGSRITVAFMQAKYYTYVEPEDQSWGKYDNGTWDGIMGLLVNKTVDISAVPYAVSLLRSNYVTFLYPIRYTYKDILYKKPDSRVDWAVLLSCFKWQVNVCVLVTIVGVTTSFLVCKRCSAHQHGRSKQVDHQMLETIMSTIGVTCKQGSSTLPNTESNRILLAFWWLCCIPITAVYSGNLVAFLTVTKDNVPFTGLNDLLDSGYDIGIETGSYVAEIFSGSNASVNKQIWKKNREHQPGNLTNEEDIVYHRIRLAEGRYALITDSDIINSYMAEKCDMAHTMEQRFPATSSLIVPKHSPLALLMDPELMFLVERGIIDKWYEQPNLDEKVCSSKEEEANGLKLTNLFTVLFVAGCGVGLAAVVLVFEICKYKKGSHRKRAQEGKGL
ncbi:glutamate receptor 1-like [Haliotis rufescens]|uniref:glutamate receptor 1-like n=1 Tax=Haliotis rufescens TaxID=6454 RepID=UPI00201EB8CF|nr:glutamate receptor 1-like [Haliotis rufescens]